MRIEARSRRCALSVTLAGLLLMLALPASSAFAGALWVTGHDQDFHCDGADAGTSGQCHYDKVAFAYVRSVAPDPNKKVLVLDNGGLAADRTATSLGVPHDTVDPSSPAFATTPLNTATYSAIVIASDASCGGCDLNGTPSGTSQTPDSDAINARAGEIATFFNSGGGVLAFAGADHGDGDASTGPDTYYNFAPIPVGGKPVSPPFCLTAIGKSLGLQDVSCPDASKHSGTLDDLNCCPTHNSFTLPPAGSGLQIAETDSAKLAETLVANGTISGGKIIGKSTTPVACLSIPNVTRNQVKRAPGGGKLKLLTGQINDPAHPLKTSVRSSGGAKISSVQFAINGHAVTATGGSVSVGVSLLRLGTKAKRNKISATVTLVNGKKVVLTQFAIILRCHVPPTSCKLKPGGKTVVCKSSTPLGGRRARVTLLGAGAGKATGSATVHRGKYTVTLHSKTALTAGTYTYKHVVSTKVPRQRYFMVRLVKVG